MVEDQKTSSTTLSASHSATYSMVVEDGGFFRKFEKNIEALQTGGGGLCT